MDSIYQKETTPKFRDNERVQNIDHCINLVTQYLPQHNDSFGEAIIPSNSKIAKLVFSSIINVLAVKNLVNASSLLLIVYGVSYLQKYNISDVHSHNNLGYQPLITFLTQDNLLFVYYC